MVNMGASRDNGFSHLPRVTKIGAPGGGADGRDFSAFRNGFIF